MKRFIFTILLLTFMTLPLVYGDDIRITDIFVAGSITYGDEYVKGFFPFPEDYTFSSFEEIDQALVFTRQRLLNTGLFMDVDLFALPLSDQEAQIYATVIENISFIKSTDMGNATFFRNFPFKGTSFGLGLLPGSLSMGLLFDINPVVKMGTGMHYIATAESRVLSPYLEFYASLLPEISLRLPVKYSSILKNIDGDSRQNDLGVKLALQGDYSYLKKLYHYGFLLDAEFFKGFWEYEYFIQRNDLALYAFHYSPFELGIEAQSYLVFGEVPFYSTADWFLQNNFRAPAQESSTHCLLLSVEPRLIDLFMTDLFIFNIGFGLSAFFDVAWDFDAFSNIDWSQNQKVVGGGLKMEFKPPINLHLRLEYGYNLDQNEGQFNILITDYF